ncbi:MAG: hypothetical protein D6734_03490, partial [Candidatus Schekmanbacteria bacterium]
MKEKEIKHWILSQLITLSICISCFFWIIKYQLHLRKYFSNFYLAPYFPNKNNLLSLPLFFLERSFQLIRYFLLGLGEFQSFLVILFFFFCITYIFLTKKFRAFGYLCFPFFITFIFAYLGFYPFGPTRQCLFLGIPIYSIAGGGAAYFYKGKTKKFLVMICMLLTFSFIINAVIYSDTFSRNWKGRIPRYFSNQMKKYKFYRFENMKPAIDFIKANFKNDENIYVFRFAQPGFLLYYNQLILDNEIWNVFYNSDSWIKINALFVKKKLPIRFGIFSREDDKIVEDFEYSFEDKKKCWFVT